jgi:hypothetical protein
MIDRPSNDEPGIHRAEAGSGASPEQPRQPRGGRALAETRSRAEYADAARTGSLAGADQQPESSLKSGHADREADDSDHGDPRVGGERGPEAEDGCSSSQLTREDYARSMRSGDPLGESSRPHRRADGAADLPEGRSDTDAEAATLRNDQAPGDAGRKSQKVAIGASVIEVTHDPADGLWVEGLPGDPPDPIGDVLSSPGENDSPRGEKLFRKAIENGDDLLDSAENNINLGHDVFARPPVRAEIAVSPQGSGAHDVPHHEIDAGNAATAALTLGLLCWTAGQWIARKARGLDDASHR